jgi:hypothetical protein
VNFPVKSYPNYTFLTEFPNKKGTFGVNLVFTTTLACTKRALFITKRALFITKKGTFSPFSPPPRCGLVNSYHLLKLEKPFIQYTTFYEIYLTN